MDERSDQIIDHIDRKRDELGRNLDELETRVRSTTDWRAQFDRHPGVMLGLALGGGILLGAMTRGGVRSYGSRAPSTSSSAYSPGTMMQRRRASETLENIKGALMGYGTAKLKTFLAQALPDFDRHYQETAHSNAPQPPTGNVWTEGSAPYSSTSGQTHGSYGSPSSSGAGQQSTGYDRENAGVRSNPTL